MRLPVFLLGWIIAMVAAGAASAWRGMGWGDILLLIAIASFSAQTLYIGYILLLSSKISRDSCKPALERYNDEAPVESA